MRTVNRVPIILLILLTVGVAVAQIADVEGDADVACVDIVSLDVRGGSTQMVISIETSGRPYPPQFLVKGVDDLSDVRLCPTGHYRFLVDTDRDDVAEHALETWIDLDGTPHTVGPPSLEANISVREGEIEWRVDNRDLGIGAEPTSVQVRAESTLAPETARPKPIQPVDYEDSAPNEWQEFIAGGEAAALVGAGGGEMRVDAGPLKGAYVRVPEAAVDEPIALNARAVANPVDTTTTSDSPAHALEVLPHGQEFAEPVLVALPAKYDEYESLYKASPRLPRWRSLGREMCEPDMRCGNTEALSWFIVKPDELCQHRRDAAPRCRALAEGFPDAQEWSEYVPVLLVHGFQLWGAENRLCGIGDFETWGDLAPLLVEEKVDVWELHYDTSAAIEDTDDILAEAVDQMLTALDSGRVTLVAHSMGGLVARSYLQYEAGYTKTARLITLGTPHLATRCANACRLVCDSCRDMAAPSSQNMDPYVFQMNDDTKEDTPVLSGPEPHYVFVAGQDYRRQDPPSRCEPVMTECFLDAAVTDPSGSDGVVSIESALARHGDEDVYGGASKKIELDAFSHTSRQVDEVCEDQPLVAPENREHLGYRKIRSHVLIEKDGGHEERGLIAYYPFEGDLRDAGPYGYDGEPVDRIRFAEGHLGQALDLPENPTGYVRVTDERPFDLHEEVSVEAWVRSQGAEWRYQGIANKGKAWRGPFELRMTRTWPYGDNLARELGCARDEHALFFHVTTGTSGWSGGGGYDYGACLTKGRWHHVAGTYDGSWVRVYVDGEEVSRRRHSGVLIENDLPLVIGSNGLTRNEIWAGGIDELKVYDRALTDEEIEQHAN